MILSAIFSPKMVLIQIKYFKYAFYFSAPIGLEDVSKYPELFTTLLASGMWTLEDLKKLAGLNFLRVFREVERVKECHLIYDNV